MSLFSFTAKPTAKAEPIMTPCIGVCELDAMGRCEGCMRSGDEIARWASMSESERSWFMDEELPRREAAAGK